MELEFWVEKRRFSGNNFGGIIFEYRHVLCVSKRIERPTKCGRLELIWWNIDRAIGEIVGFGQFRGISGRFGHYF